MGEGGRRLQEYKPSRGVKKKINAPFLLSFDRHVVNHLWRALPLANNMEVGSVFLSGPGASFKDVSQVRETAVGGSVVKVRCSVWVWEGGQREECSSVLQSCQALTVHLY